MKAENRKGCPQRDGVERKEYAGAQSFSARESKERGGANDLLERILERENLNRAYKQVKRNHGAPGIDGMTVEKALLWIRENREELLKAYGKAAINQTQCDARKSRNLMAGCGNWGFPRW